MRQNNEEYELGTVEVIVNKVEKTLTKVIFSDYLGTIEYTLTYGEGGQIEKIGYTVEAEGETQEMIYNVKREGEQILIADEEEAETFTYVLKDGKIASYVDAYGTSFRSARFFVTAENLFLLTNYSGIDPELIDPTNGMDNLTSYPLPRKFTVGLTVNF